MPIYSITDSAWSANYTIPNWGEVTSASAPLNEYTTGNITGTGLNTTGGLTYGNYGYYESGITTDNHVNPWINEYTLAGTDTNYRYNGTQGSITVVPGSGSITISNEYTWWPQPQTKNELFQSKLKSNLFILVKSRVQLPGKVSPEEQIAMETLREFISETEFRKYMRYGFVLVKGKSGDTFQIFRNRSHTKVWRNGQVVEEVCVRIQDSKVPPTDNVIAFRSIIQSDEEAFRKLGNVYKMKKAA
jgi:hypothetical protein